MHDLFQGLNFVTVIIAAIGWMGFIFVSIFMIVKGRDRRYQKKHRLGDVIRLINALGLESNDFKNESDIDTALRAKKPMSAAIWFKVLADHPEFFRQNGDYSRYALVARSYIKVEANQPRPPLEQQDVQKLCDLAVTFHDKEVQQSQSYTLWFPLIAAVLASVTLILTSFFTNYYAAKNNLPAMHNDRPTVTVKK